MDPILAIEFAANSKTLARLMMLAKSPQVNKGNLREILHKASVLEDPNAIQSLGPLFAFATKDTFLETIVSTETIAQLCKTVSDWNFQLIRQDGDINPFTETLNAQIEATRGKLFELLRYDSNIIASRSVEIRLFGVVARQRLLVLATDADVDTHNVRGEYERAIKDYLLYYRIIRELNQTPTLQTSVVTPPPPVQTSVVTPSPPVQTSVVTPPPSVQTSVVTPPPPVQTSVVTPSPPVQTPFEDTTVIEEESSIPPRNTSSEYVFHWDAEDEEFQTGSEPPYTQTPPTQSYTQTPPNQSYAQTPPNQSYTQTPPNQSYAQTPPNQSYTQTPPNQSYTQTPPNQSYTQTPPNQSYTQTPPNQSYAQTPPNQSYAQTPNPTEDYQIWQHSVEKTQAGSRPIPPELEINTPPQPIPIPETTKEDSKKSRAKIFIIFSIVLVLIGGVALLFVPYPSANKPTTTPKTEISKEEIEKKELAENERLAELEEKSIQKVQETLLKKESSNLAPIIEALNGVEETVDGYTYIRVPTGVKVNDTETYTQLRVSETTIVVKYSIVYKEKVSKAQAPEYAEKLKPGPEEPRILVEEVYSRKSGNLLLNTFRAYTKKGYYEGDDTRKGWNFQYYN